MPETIALTEESAPSNETEVSTNVSGPVITTEQRSTEVLDTNGRSLSSQSALGDIFDKIIEGKTAKTAIKEVMSAPEAKTEVIEETPAPAEVVIESKKEEKKVEPVVEVEAKPTEEVQEEELRVLPHDKPKTAKRIEKLLQKLGEAESKITTTSKEAQEKAERLKQLEEQIAKASSANPLEHEEVKKRLDELSMYRRKYELENDPEVKRRFDDRVTAAENDISKLLAGNRAPEALVNLIKEEGGWFKFVESQRSIKLATGKDVTAAELAETIRSQLSPVERRKLEVMELEQIQAARDKQTYFNEESKRANEYFQQRDAEAKRVAEEQKKVMDEAVRHIVDWKGKFVAENDWLQEKQLDSKLSAEQRAAIEDHNTYAKQTLSVLDKYMAAKDVNGMLEVLRDAVSSHHERRRLAFALADKAKLEAALKAKTEELDRIKRASATTRNGSLTAPPTRTVEAEAKGPRSLEQAFDMLAEGKNLSGE